MSYDLVGTVDVQGASVMALDSIDRVDLAR